MIRFSKVLVWTALLALSLFAANAGAADRDYHLAPGDDIKVFVFQNPDLTLETRVAGNGSIMYPLIGKVDIAGLTPEQGADAIAKALVSGGFLKNPQVNITLMQALGNQVSVLGAVNRPGRYPLNAGTYRLTDVIAMAGGVTDTGSDTAILMGTRAGKPYRAEINVPSLFIDNKADQDVHVAGGDSIFVGRAAMFYVYGEVQKPGAYRLERNMTVMQGLAQGGGATLRGSERSLKVYRREASGKLDSLSLPGSESLQPNDVIYVPESIF